MKKFFILALSFSLSGCLKSDFDYTDVVYQNSLEYLDDESLPVTNDPFQIIGITPEAANWKIIVEYPGGCENHTFLVSWNQSLSADSSHTSFRIFHDSNDDSCKALVRDTLDVDLETLFGGHPFNESQPVIEAINSFNGRSIAIHPSLAAIPQSLTCSLETVFENSLCGYGIWQNNWFRLTDTLYHPETIWFQPIKSKEEYVSEVPENEGYTIGVTLLFGYQFQNVDPNCLVVPEGIVIPAVINCYEKKI